MKHSQCLALTLALVSASTVTGWSQAPPENWLKPRKTQISRDAAGLTVIQKSLVAMNPQSLPRIADASLELEVSEWEGKPVSGTCQERSIGLFAESKSVVIDGTIVEHTLRKGGVQTSQQSDGTVSSVNDKRAFEQIPLMPQLLLQEVLLNSLDEIESLPEDADAPNQVVVRITVRGPTWKPEVRDLASASFDLYFDEDTHLLNRVLGLVHTDGNPRHYLPREIDYSQYQTVQSLLLPQNIEERFAGKSMNIFSVKSIAINQGLATSSLN